MNPLNLAGVFAPIPTPFDEQDRVDTTRLRAAIDRWMKIPLTGLVVLGSNGEAVLLDEFESDQAIVAAREAVPKGRGFIVGTGRESTQAAVRAAKRAAEHGADAVLVRTPGFFKPQMTNDAFVRHYTAVADASPVPVLLYNFTALTGVTLQPAAVAKLATHPNIIGMKESGGDAGQINDLVSATPDDFRILAGSAGTFYASLCVGAIGGILALACVVPDACMRLFELTRAGKHKEALALQRQLVPLSKLLGQAYGVPGLKAAMSLIGYDVGVPRPPLTPVPEAAVKALRDAIAQLEGIPA
ncbi:MAG: dihydrodipicolinate synthase family protein [Acidobacteriia bacterium]|nr:dihydrodipicolinate synthase family protein [Terriglobia bacterium]